MPVSYQQIKEVLMVLSLAACLNKPVFSHQLKAVRDVLKGAKVDITFWGERVIKIKGMKCSVSLEGASKKTVRAATQRSKSDDLKLAERIAGMDLVKTLKNFYRVTDKQISRLNFFTRSLVWIREFSLLPYTTRFFIEDRTESKFRAYSKAKFIRQFGGSFDPTYNHPASDGLFGPPLRIIARESVVRAQQLRA
jgi:hypothetical protein